MQLPRRADEVRSDYRQRAARIAESLNRKIGATSWVRTQLERYWKLAQKASNRPQDTPDSCILNSKGSLWRLTVQAGARTARENNQGHPVRGFQWRWDWWLQHFFNVHSPDPDSWQLHTDHDPRWQDEEWARLMEPFITWRLSSWRGGKPIREPE